MEYRLYCPCCGHLEVSFDEPNTVIENCLFCKTLLKNTLKSTKYFMDAVGGADHVEDLHEYIRQQYVYNDPQFDAQKFEEYKAYKKQLAAGANSGYQAKCPTCGSPNISKIGAGKKVASVGLFGVFAIGHVSKTFKCNNCGMKF